MAESFVIPLRVTGLVKADFSFRLYRDGARIAASEAAITVAELSGGDYLVAGLPSGVTGQWLTLTWEYPAGAGSAYTWPAQAGAPTAVVIPYRDAGAVAADFNLVLYRNGVAQADALTVVELGSGASPGDYKVTGWPTPAAGDRWLLTWQLAGMAFSTSWTGAVTSTATATAGGAVRFRNLHTRLIRRFGGESTVTIRRRHTLKGQRKGEPTNTFAVQGAHSLGATTLVLRAVSAVPLTGKLRAGHVLTLAAVNYTVDADCEASSGLISVPLTSGLTGAAADGAEVVITTPYVDYSFFAFRRDSSVMDEDTGERVMRRGLRLAYRGDCTPEPGDLVVVDGEARGISGVTPINLGPGEVSYRLTMG